MSTKAQNEQIQTFKLLLIGNSSVGKSSLLLRFTNDDFVTDDEASATIGVDFKIKNVDIENKRYKLSIWDTAGQERFRTLTSSYYRGAQGVILVYDVTNEESFNNLKVWFKELETYSNNDAIKIVVGNKVDQSNLRKVSYQDGLSLSNDFNAMFIECSAKTSIGVEQLFYDVVNKIISTPSLHKPLPSQSSTAVFDTRTGSVIVGNQSAFSRYCSC